jgi:hypothetical protein
MNSITQSTHTPHLLYPSIHWYLGWCCIWVSMTSSSVNKQVHISLQCLKKLEIQLLHDQATPPLGVYPMKIKSAWGLFYLIFALQEIVATSSVGRPYACYHWANMPSALPLSNTSNAFAFFFFFFKIVSHTFAWGSPPSMILLPPPPV